MNNFSPVIIFIVVVFPAPLWPNNAVICPLNTFKFVPATANLTLPFFLNAYMNDTDFFLYDYLPHGVHKVGFGKVHKSGITFFRPLILIPAVRSRGSASNNPESSFSTRISFSFIAVCLLPHQYHFYLEEIQH